ncbi:hypothetical protein PHIM7_3 [Sinorhizobium phage phiM7]|uniref:Transmembrane protein n=1 Tax=Sinorhizobium phage phiM7 TaxID=1647403 RepID=A0A0F6WBI9_9CAUD|nr:hypothetical protein FDH46_gp003 [Sinorhizobium phage phiM7]AKF12551.1 hypothetical protein PHIM7_3 [Sinorhizobium phage phiM7]AKF12911.1 hypothetical protein PHIM19_4 [Sinorhizobium phage phiM19]
MIDPNVYSMELQRAHSKMLASLWLSAFVPFWFMWGMSDDQ